MMTILYDLLYMVPLCLMTVFGFRVEIGAPEKNLPLFLVLVLWLGSCMLLKHWKNRLRFLLPGVLAALGIGVTMIQKPEARVDFFYQNQWILWAILMTTGCFFAGWLLAENRLVRRILAISLIIGLLFIMGFMRYPDKAVVAISFFLILSIAADEIQLRWKKGGYTDGKGHLVSIAPFLLLTCLLTWLIPAPEKPYDWGFVVRIWERASSAVKMTSRWFGGNNEDYGGIIGFSDEGNFWGNLSSRERNQITLSGGEDVGEVVYLAGKVMDAFDGRNWSVRYEEENRDRMLDTLETLCVVTQHDPEYVRNYVCRLSMDLQYEDFSTSYLFTPLKPVIGKDRLGSVDYDQKGGDLLARKILGYGTKYSVDFFKLNLGHSSFREFLRNGEEIDPQTWEKVRRQYEPLDPHWKETEEDRDRNAGTSYEDYLSYRERIYEYYLPETKLSEKLTPYVEKWLEGAETDYDKLCRFEDVLSQCSYTLTPGKLPESVQTPEDFLDYLLLDSQQGYCSHFATAFVLLARSQGIPARYVQGFYVPKGGAQTVTVKSSMAHSWPEVYLDGIGWIPFEPTPGKKKVETWAFVKKSTQTSPTNETHEEREEHKEDQLPEQEKEGKSFEIPWRVILIPLGAVMAFLIAFLLIDRAVTKARYRRLDEAGKFRVTCRKNLRILNLLGLKIEQGETLEEFAGRASAEISPELLGFLGDCELAAYAGKTPTLETRKAAEKELEGLLVILKAAKGKWFFWYRFLIGRMEGEKTRS